MRNLVPVARRLRRDSTDAERVLWRQLRDRQMHGLKFRRQHPLAGYVLDFYCEELRLCVELDGGQHAERAADDEARSTVLGKLGVTVVRFWNDDLLRNPDGVWQRLQEAIERLRQVTSPDGRGRPRT